MARLIDADALELKPDPWGGMNGVLMLGRSGGKTMATAQAALKCMIDNAPTVDAVEVVHGRWERISWWQHKKRYEMDKCTVCGHQVKPKDARYFCPNCGADMRDGDGNG